MSVGKYLEYPIVSPMLSETRIWGFLKYGYPKPLAFSHSNNLEEFGLPAPASVAERFHLTPFPARASRLPKASNMAGKAKSTQKVYHWEIQSKWVRLLNFPIFQ